MSIVVTAEDEFAEFCRQHEAWLRRYIRRRMADPTLVDDALQETLLRAYRSRSAPEDGNLRPWLAVLAARACADVWRAEPPADRVSSAALEDRFAGTDVVVPGSEDHVAALVRRRRINEALASLSPRHRRVLELRAFMGLSYEAIARESDESIPCVTSVLGRARRRFVQSYLAAPDLSASNPSSPNLSASNLSGSKRSTRGRPVVVPVGLGLFGRLRHRLGRLHATLLSHAAELGPASVAVGVVGIAAVLSLPLHCSHATATGFVVTHMEEPGPPPTPAVDTGPVGSVTESRSSPAPVVASTSRPARPGAGIAGTVAPAPGVQADPEVRISPERTTVWVRVGVETPVLGWRAQAAVGVRCTGSATLQQACPVLDVVDAAD